MPSYPMSYFIANYFPYDLCHKGYMMIGILVDVMKNPDDGEFNIVFFGY